MTRREWLQSIAIGSPALIGLPARGQSATWKAGVAKTDITPTEPIWLAGYGARTKPSEGVLQNIFVKCVALQSPDGTPSAFVTSDLLGFPKDIADEITRECLDKYKLPRERLILNASHTHSAPVVGRMLRPAYPTFTKEQEDTIARYTDGIVKKVVATIGAALADLQPAAISFGQGLAGFAVNRRRSGTPPSTGTRRPRRSRARHPQPVRPAPRNLVRLRLPQHLTRRLPRERRLGRVRAA